MHSQRLTQEETLSLLADWQSKGDVTARNKIVMSYRNIIWLQVHRLHVKPDMQEDFFQEGILGLIKACDKYEEGHGSSFINFAYICVTAQLAAAIAYQQYPVSIRNHSESRKWMYMIKALVDEREQHGEMVSYEEMAKHVGIRKDTAAGLYEAGRSKAVSLSEAAHVACDDYDEEPAMAAKIRAYIEKLGERNKGAIVDYFWNEKNVEQIGSKLGVTKGSASNFICRELKKMRKHMKGSN